MPTNVRSKQASALLAGLALAAACACAQQPPQATSAAPVNQIRLDVTVDNRAGEPVTGLTAADFRVLDNKKPEPITSFRAVTAAELPTDIILVLDAVNMPYTRLSYARQELARFLSANGGKLAQPTSIAIIMDVNSQALPTFTTDGNALKDTLDKYSIGLRTIHRSSGFYGASERFNISLQALRMLVEREMQRPGRKRIVWISPGWPLLSGPEVDLTAMQRRTIFADIVALSTEIRQAHVTLDAVNPLGAEVNVGEINYFENFVSGVRKPDESQIGDLALQVLATQSGGLVLNSSNDIAALLQRSVDQTKAFYQLTFPAAPGERPNEYHQIQVQLARPGLVAHTTAGYYARPAIIGAPAQVTPTPVR